MCGIVGAVAQRDISDILLMGLQSLEYRGYDSAGVATIGADGSLNRLRRVGKVKQLADAVEAIRHAWRYGYRAYSLGYAWRAQ